MKALKIDAWSQTITEIELGDWKTYAPAIGHGCDTFTVAAYLPNGDALFVDDEGLLRPDQVDRVFRCPWHSEPLAGNGLIIGTGPEGDSADCKSEADIELASKIQFGRMVKAKDLGPDAEELLKTLSLLGGAIR